MTTGTSTVAGALYMVTDENDWLRSIAVTPEGRPSSWEGAQRFWPSFGSEEKKKYVFSASRGSRYAFGVKVWAI